MAHSIWIDDDDIERLARAGVTAVHNPLSNLRLGSGVAAVRRMKARGLRVALGTDGANTSDTQNLFEAARLAAYLSRIVEADERHWITAGEAWEMGTAHSAHALGWGDRLGRLAPGRASHLVLTFSPGRLSAWLDGERTLDERLVPGDFFHWNAVHLVLGGEERSAARWRGWRSTNSPS